MCTSIYERSQFHCDMFENVALKFKYKNMNQQRRCAVLHISSIKY